MFCNVYLCSLNKPGHLLKWYEKISALKHLSHIINIFFIYNFNVCNLFSSTNKHLNCRLLINVWFNWCFTPKCFKFCIRRCACSNIIAKHNTIQYHMFIFDSIADIFHSIAWNTILKQNNSHRSINCKRYA